MHYYHKNIEFPQGIPQFAETTICTEILWLHSGKAFYSFGFKNKCLPWEKISTLLTLKYFFKRPTIEHLEKQKRKMRITKLKGIFKKGIIKEINKKKQLMMIILDWEVKINLISIFDAQKWRQRDYGRCFIYLPFHFPQHAAIVQSGFWQQDFPTPSLKLSSFGVFFSSSEKTESKLPKF